MIKERNKSLDIAKGLGIILIVWGHEVCPLRNQLLLFHVPLFILISGLLYEPKGTFRQYINKKTHSLLLPYIKYLIIGFVIWLCYHYQNINFDDILYVCDINYPRINGPIWFLLSLFWINIIYFFIEQIHPKSIKTFIVLLISTFSIILINYNINYLFFTHALLMLLFYHVGYISKSLISNLSKWSILIISIVFLAGIYLTFTKQYHCETIFLIIGDNIFYYYIFGLSGSLLTIYFSELLSKYNYSNLLSYIGKKSLIILGLHFIIVIPINSFYKEVICEVNFSETICYTIKIMYSLLSPLFTVFIILLVNKTYLHLKTKFIISKKQSLT